MTSSEGTKGAETGQARRAAGAGRLAVGGDVLRSVLGEMEAAALRAAHLIGERAHEGASLVWEAKSPTDFVSEVDTSAETLIRSLLEGRIVPGAETATRVLGEEHSPDASLDGDGIVFVVDPLDGTTNFLHGYPWYAVSIGATVNGVLAAAVVVNAATGERFTATLGGGAFRDGLPIRASSNDDPQRALIGTGFPFKHLEGLEAYQRQFAAVARRTAGIRRAGAAALDLCDVACGRFDAFWELRLAPWDVAAGMLIIREAGGIVTDLAGAPAPVGHGPIVAGSAAMHPWLLATLNEGQSSEARER